MRTPLHWSAGCNPDVEVAKCLVEHGADIRAEDDRGLTPLDLSLRYAKSDAVGLYFLDLMMGSKGREVTDPVELAAIKQRFM
jgi:ankyrin repeat protein